MLKLYYFTFSVALSFIYGHANAQQRHPPGMALNYLATMEPHLSANEKKECVLEVKSVVGDRWEQYVRFLKSKNQIFFVCGPGCGNIVENLECIINVEYDL